MYSLKIALSLHYQARKMSNIIFGSFFSFWTKANNEARKKNTTKAKKIDNFLFACYFDAQLNYFIGKIFFF